MSALSEQEWEIVRKYESGQTQTSIALNYNINQMSVSRILRKHRDLARKESNGPSVTTPSIPAYQIYDQTQNLYSTHMFQNAVQSRMLYAQV